MSNIFHILFLLIIILLSLCSGSDILYNHTSSDQNLYFVFSTFCHGARSVFSHKDYFGNDVPHPGDLSAYGAIQHLEIGKKYRQRYSNFLNMSFDKNQMYIRSSYIERCVQSALKELEGLFGKIIDRSNVDIIKNGNDYWNLFQLNYTERQEVDKYFDYCNRKRKLPDYSSILRDEIFPILKECYGAQNLPNIGIFCDSVFTAYFEYTYNNDTDNLIGKCGKDKAEKMHQYCYGYFNTFRNWYEKAAYMFNILFQNIFKHMRNFVEGKSDLRMIMISGHDITTDKVMDFLSGLKIVERTHFPHYACNIVFELRKYNDEFYIEIYYNDILRYNQTFQTFSDTLENSKYGSLYNFCGLPPWIEIIKETDQIKTEIIKEIPATQKLEEKKETEVEIIPPTQNLEEKSKEPIPPSQKVEEKPKVEIPITQKVDSKPESILPTQKVEEKPKVEIPITQKVDSKPEPILPTHKVEEKPKVEIPITQKVDTKPEPILPTQKVEEKPKEEIPLTPKVDNNPEPPLPTQKVEEKPKEDLPSTQKVENKQAPILPTQKAEEKQKEEIPPTQKVEETKKIIETENLENIKIDENKIEKKNDSENKNKLIPLNNSTELNEVHKSNKTKSNFEKIKTSLKKLFKQDTDLNLYIILISIIATIILIVLFIILFIYISKRRKRKFIRLTEDQSKNKNDNNNYNLSVISTDVRKDEKK